MNKVLQLSTLRTAWYNDATRRHRARRVALMNDRTSQYFRANHHAKTDT